jgi:hypothetical protein
MPETLFSPQFYYHKDQEGPLYRTMTENGGTLIAQKNQIKKWIKRDENDVKGTLITLLIRWIQNVLAIV